jgi:hypothetical protein
MGWPRKNEECRIYQERGKNYLLVIVENGLNGAGNYDCIVNATDGPKPNLCSTTCSPEFLLNRCRRVQWSDLTEEWKLAFIQVMREWNHSDPAEIRGFWKSVLKPY